MQLVVAVVNADDAGSVSDALLDSGVHCTRLSTSGGFLGIDNATLLAGVDASQVDEVMAIIRRHAHRRVQPMQPLLGGIDGTVLLSPPLPVDVEVSGATVFVLDVARFEKL